MMQDQMIKLDSDKLYCNNWCYTGGIIFLYFTRKILWRNAVNITNYLIRRQSERHIMNKIKFNLSWRRPISYRNQSIYLRSKSMDWLLYDIGLRHERVKLFQISPNTKYDSYFKYLSFQKTFCNTLMNWN